MGCISSTIADMQQSNAFYSEHPEHATKNKITFDKLLLSENDIHRLYKSYVKIDQDLSGEIATWELLEYLKLERTKFTKRIFRMFDEDGSGQIDFREFVIALWNYCTLGKPALIMFAFDLYDQDGSGAIDVKEVEMMLKEVYGRKYENNTHAQIIRKKIAVVAGERNDSVSVDYFSEFVRKHPALLFPAFELQTTIQRNIVGSEFWADASEHRLKLTNGEYVNINQILKAHISNAAFDSLVSSKKIVDGQSSRENAATKEKIKGALLVSGLHGERRFKGSLGQAEIEREIVDLEVEGKGDDTFEDFDKWKSFKDKERAEEEPRGKSKTGEKWKSAQRKISAANAFKSPPRRKERKSSEGGMHKSLDVKQGSSGRRKTVK